MISMLICLGLTDKSYAINKDGKIYKNVYVENIDVSGLSKSESIGKINKIVNKDNNIKLLYKGKEYKLNLKDIGFNYKIKEAIDKAYKVGRSETCLSNTKMKINLQLGEKVKFKLNVGYDKYKLNSYISNLYKEIYIQPINSNINLGESGFEVSKEVNGIELNRQQMFEMLNKKIMNRDYSTCDIPISVIKPKYTFDKLSKINTILGTYETSFNSKNNNRANNIKVATNKINNILIDSNESFSFNKLIGKRSIEQGFKEAPIILNGDMKLGMGGGICQVSSTVYNAALYSGLEIVQARNHSIPSGYIQKGRDATVSYGNIDLIFKNKYNSPILIQNRVEDNRIISTIYGSEEDRKEIDIKIDIVKTIPQKIVVKESDKLSEGKTEVSERGRKGYKVNTYRLYKNKDGNIDKEEFINESYYPPKNKIVLKGIKKNDDNLNRFLH
jgi:vancomycin resistance protein YoaR